MSHVRAARAGAAILAAGALATVAVGPGTASAASYPPIAVTCTIDPNPAHPHSSITISCTGFLGPVHIHVVVNGVILTADTDSRPSFSALEQTKDAGASIFEVTGRDLSGVAQSVRVATNVQDDSAVGAAAAARQSSASTCTSAGSVSTSHAVLGRPVVFSGGGVAPGAPVTVSDSSGRSVGATNADAAGRFSLSTLPASVGQLTLYAVGVGASCPKAVSVAAFTVAKPHRALLPFTGLDGLILLILLAVVLLAGGSGVVAMARRRRLVRLAR
jgi:hypothetical protein